MRLSALLTSLSLHAATAAVLWTSASGMRAEVAGESGLRGSPFASFAIEMEAAPASPVGPARAVASRPRRTVREGIAIAKAPPTELPAELKAEPRIIEDEVESAQAQAESPSRATSEPGSLPGQPGQGGTSDRAAATLGNSTRTNEIGIYMENVRRAIDRQLPTTHALAQDRRTFLQFVILGNGHIEDLVVSRSSGDPKLDQSAQIAVRRALPFPPPPREGRLKVTLPVLFTTRRFGAR